MDLSLKEKLTQYAPFALCALIVFIFLAQAGTALSGELVSNDDMMRLSQIRDLMAGQAWFDVSQSRFMTPEHGAMHWSRIPDLPILVIIAVLQPFVGQVSAEALAITVWPITLLFLFLLALIRAVRLLGGRWIAQSAVVVVFASSAASFQFAAGRIDHHGLMILLCVLGLNGLLSQKQTWQTGARAGLAFASMVAIAVEGLPYVVLGVGAMAIVWILRGGVERDRLAGFGGALAAAGLLFFVLDAPGAGARSVCDAFGFGHLIALMVGGLSFVAIAINTHRFSTDRYRWAVMIGAGALTAGLTFILAPECFASPYAGLSDLAKEAWLSNVGEARSVDRLWQEAPDFAVSVFGFAIAGLAAGVWMMRQTSGPDRVRWIIWFVMALGALLVMVWQLRAVSFAHSLAGIGAAMALARTIETWGQQGGVDKILGIAVAMALLMPPSWQAYGSLLEQDTELDPSTHAEAALMPACTSRAAMVSLTERPTANIFSPINLGAPILTYTPHTIYAAPYHRNVGAIETVIDIYTGSADQARARLQALGADFLLHCPYLGEYKRYVRLAPAGFANTMLAGEMSLPGWLDPVPLEGETPLKLYRIVPSDE